MNKFYSISCIAIIFVFIVGTPYAMQPASTVSASPLNTKDVRRVSKLDVLTTSSATSMPIAINPAKPDLWLDSTLPLILREDALSWGLTVVEDKEDAEIMVEFAAPAPGALHVSTWTYALVAPFPTVLDDISADELKEFWMGNSMGVFDGAPLLMAESILAAFSAAWGEPALGVVRVVPEDELLDVAWSEMPSWAIVPFEELQPKWKVLSIDGNSPIRKDFDPSAYPLVLMFRVRGQDEKISFKLTENNYDPDKLTTVILTGVTALVRGTARIMEAKGVLTPGRDVRDVFREADILHISNEVPFYRGCPSPNSAQLKLVFCSDPRYMDLLTDIGVDIIEITGDHFGDYGTDATMQTIEMYKELGIPYFGGGVNIEDAKQPRIMEHNGNKIAFIGCNGKGKTYTLAFAAKNKPGAFSCDYEYMSHKIIELHEKGYVVITTFQWHESNAYDPFPDKSQYIEFRLMADSGADIVSGSQAHSPQTMEFHGDSFIHYGLGNLFFDQMGDGGGEANGIRREFADQYVIYDNKYISTEIITNMLEDYSRPRPMTLKERQVFLYDYFIKSGWINDSPKSGIKSNLLIALPPSLEPDSTSLMPTATPSPFLSLAIAD